MDCSSGYPRVTHCRSIFRAMGKCSDGHAYLAVPAAVILAIGPMTTAFAENASQESPPVREPAAALDDGCRLPDHEIAIPDGSRATMTEMLTAQAAVRHFDALITAYTHCLIAAQTRLLVRDPELATTLGAARIERNNAAVERAERLVAAFNAEFRIFRSRGYRSPVIRRAATESDRAFCDPLRRYESTINVEISLSDTGEMTAIALPPGIARDVEIVVRCLVRKFAFDPASLDTIPQPAIFTMPLRLGKSHGHLTTGDERPVLKTSDSQIAAARYRCIPSDLERGGEVGVHLTIGPLGKVVGVKTVISSGVDAVDLAATCIAKSLSYEPIQVGGLPAEMSMLPMIVKITPRGGSRSADDG